MNIVRELRIKKGIQQKELALELGVSSAAVSNWEKGKSDPSGERLQKLAEIFAVDESVILGYGQESQGPFVPIDPKTAGVSETEQIVQYVLKNLKNEKTPEIKIVSGMMEKMTKTQQEQVVAVVRAMFANHPELLD